MCAKWCSRSLHCGSYNLGKGRESYYYRATIASSGRPCLHTCRKIDSEISATMVDVTKELMWIERLVL